MGLLLVVQTELLDSEVLSITAARLIYRFFGQCKHCYIFRRGEK